jgi:hypothetical protein
MDFLISISLACNDYIILLIKEKIMSCICNFSICLLGVMIKQLNLVQQGNCNKCLCIWLSQVVTLTIKWMYNLGTYTRWTRKEVHR